MVELGCERVQQLLPLVGDAQPSFAVDVAALGLLKGQVALFAVIVEAVRHCGDITCCG